MALLQGVKRKLTRRLQTPTTFHSNYSTYDAKEPFRSAITPCIYQRTDEHTHIWNLFVSQHNQQYETRLSFSKLFPSAAHLSKFRLRVLAFLAFFYLHYSLFCGSISQPTAFLLYVLIYILPHSVVVSPSHLQAAASARLFSLKFCVLFVGGIYFDCRVSFVVSSNCQTKSWCLYYLKTGPIWWGKK